uniref:Predicted protein n=1 Tax=Hordeum vulgare subsp. vulgare TaxID=112509 RepID=F2EDX6_HORVV|nr:predicted protein [Hordeum vulgare subsp. vulgare]
MIQTSGLMDDDECPAPDGSF